MDNVSAIARIAAPAARVFEVLADPVTHASIDGTGWVRKSLGRESLTEVGQVFWMEMYHPNASEGYYRVANEILVCDAPRAIAWRTGYDPNGDGNLEFGGWFWRYDLKPASPTETEVTHTYDWSAVPPHIREYLDFPPFGPDHLPNSLRHLAELAAPA